MLRPWRRAAGGLCERGRAAGEGRGWGRARCRRPVFYGRPLPAGTRCSSWAAPSCGSSAPTSSCWRCGPACRSPRTRCSSASPWSECTGRAAAALPRGARGSPPLLEHPPAPKAPPLWLKEGYCAPGRAFWALGEAGAVLGVQHFSRGAGRLCLPRGGVRKKGEVVEVARRRRGGQELVLRDSFILAALLLHIKARMQVPETLEVMFRSLERILSMGSQKAQPGSLSTANISCFYC